MSKGRCSVVCRLTRQCEQLETSGFFYAIALDPLYGVGALPEHDHSKTEKPRIRWMRLLSSGEAASASGTVAAMV